MTNIYNNQHYKFITQTRAEAGIYCGHTLMRQTTDFQLNISQAQSNPSSPLEDSELTFPPTQQVDNITPC